MKETYILAIDQGTTSTRSIIFNRKGQIMASSQMEIAQICPNNGWVEQNPEEIFETVIQTIKDALNQAHLSIESIEALGITNQRKQPFSGIKLPESRLSCHRLAIAAIDGDLRGVISKGTKNRPPKPA